MLLGVWRAAGGGLKALATVAKPSRRRSRAMVMLCVLVAADAVAAAAGPTIRRYGVRGVGFRHCHGCCMSKPVGVDSKMMLLTPPN